MNKELFIIKDKEITIKQVTSEEEFQNCLTIRKKVFIQEQKVPEKLEIDEFEKTSIHFLVHYRGRAVGTSRLREDGDSLKFERIAILSSERGKQLGHLLLKSMMQFSAKFFPNKHWVMHAQSYALPFYKKLGWKESGESFLEANIEHYLMEYLQPGTAT